MTDESRPIEGLDRLRVPPPADLEDAVVDALAARGWIGDPRRGTGARPAGSPGAGRSRRSPLSAWRPWAAAAVATGLFLLGAWVGGRRGGAGDSTAGGPPPGVGEPPLVEAPPGEATGSRYVLLLYEGSGFVQPASAAEHAALVRAYVAWSDSVRAAGYPLVGEELADPAGGVSLPPPGAAEGPDVLAGFHVLTAPDLETALAIARTHPHLKRGGRIVVRPIVEH